MQVVRKHPLRQRVVQGLQAVKVWLACDRFRFATAGDTTGGVLARLDRGQVAAALGK